jgi:glutamate--cysteine ligase
LPAPTRQLSVADVARHVAAAAVGPASRPRDEQLVGVELEWLVMTAGDAAARVPHARVDDELVTRSLPASGRVTFEPGGQLELSTRPLPGVGAACAAAEADTAALARRLGRRDIELVGLGFDPVRDAQRVVRSPRYDSMERYFDRHGPHGRRMMCSTAAIQVNVALGAGADPAGRWQRCHAAAPVLAAAFANSPIVNGQASGWRSARLATWAAMDPTRTRPVGGTDPGSAWSAYALAARVMMVVRDDGVFAPLLSTPTLREWIEHGSPEGWPTLADVDYHLTTLFPPVRPRGWLEVRVIDALPDPWWRAAVAVTAAVADERAARDVAAACSLTGELGDEAARHGLSHPILAAAARRLFRIASGLLPDLGGDSVVASVVDEFEERYVLAGRSPADDRLDEWAGSGRCIPPNQPPRERSRA